MLIPLRVDVPMTRRAWSNYALLAGVVLVSILGFSDIGFFLKLGGIEVTAADEVRLTTADYPLPVLAVTSSFLHAGWVHLIGNLLFLWVFGNAVNYKFGQAGYIGLYLAAALAGGLAHYGIVGGPAVGASGAINGIMGAFLVFFPRNEVTILWLGGLFRGGVGIHSISSVWIILLWVGFDLAYIVFGWSTTTALWGHLAGFAAGLAIAIVCAATCIVRPTEDEQTLLQVFANR